MDWDKADRFDSSNENVSKYVFTKKDAIAESVLYKYGTYSERTVICCSSQAGCPVGCRFCGTGNFFIRSLTSNEIVSQVEHLLADRQIVSSEIEKFQIMFMSMGEPALNQKNLVEAIKILNVKYPQAALLISSSGPRVPYQDIVNISMEIPKVGLQFSVHESTDEARDKLIPLKGKLKLFEIAELGEYWAMKTGRTPYFNYCVHDKNNTDDDVQRLRTLFNPNVWQATLSVICEQDEGVAAANERQRSLTDNFATKMMELGYNTRVFDPAGQDDIGGGCGQLWFVQRWAQENPSLVKKSCGSGLDKIHTPM